MSVHGDQRGPAGRSVLHVLEGRRAGPGAHDIDADELLTVAEIARALQLNEQTIRNWIDAGRLPHLRAGARRVRVWRSDFEAFVEGSAERSARAEPPLEAIWDGFIADPVGR